MSKRSHNSENIVQLNDTTLAILEEYNERYFKAFADSFIKAWSKAGKDPKGTKRAISFLYKSANYEEKEFADFLNQNFPEPRSETEKNCHENLTRISNCCHINDHEQELAKDVVEMIGYCKKVSELPVQTMNDKIAEYLQDRINSHLNDTSPFIYEAIAAQDAHEILEQKQRKNRRFEPIIVKEIEEAPRARSVSSEDEDEKFSEEELRKMFSSREDVEEEEVASLFSSLSSSDPSRSPNNSSSQALQKRQRTLS